jgi:hypothetical protein
MALDQNTVTTAGVLITVSTLLSGFVSTQMHTVFDRVMTRTREIEASLRPYWENEQKELDTIGKSFLRDQWLPLNITLRSRFPQSVQLLNVGSLGGLIILAFFADPANSLLRGSKLASRDRWILLFLLVFQTGLVIIAWLDYRRMRHQLLFEQDCTYLGQYKRTLKRIHQAFLRRGLDPQAKAAEAKRWAEWLVKQTKERWPDAIGAKAIADIVWTSAIHSDREVDYQPSVPVLEKVTSAASSSPRWNAELAWLYLRIDDRQKAIESWKRYANRLEESGKDPESPWSRRAGRRADPQYETKGTLLPPTEFQASVLDTLDDINGEVSEEAIDEARRIVYAFVRVNTVNGRMRKPDAARFVAMANRVIDLDQSNNDDYGAYLFLWHCSALAAESLRGTFQVKRLVRTIAAERHFPTQYKV